MSCFKVTLAYDGTRYVGWQRQAAGTSIQGLIEDALRPLDGRDVVVSGAGRTDAGVHALGQVASFSLARAISPEQLGRALNGQLPDDVRVIAVEAAADDFHARFGAKAKTYRYRFSDARVASPFERFYVWHVAGSLDVEAMDRAARKLEGRHDFAAFQAAGGATRSAERIITRSQVYRADGPGAFPLALEGGEAVVFEITGNGFLRHMVRAIAGTLAEIGRGRWPWERMGEVLESRDRSRAGPTAPAAGLFLVSIQYEEVRSEK